MKFKITVDDRTFEVEVGDLHSRPILATVDGDTFEVWPQDEIRSQAVTATVKAQAPAVRKTASNGVMSADAGSSVYAPIPGVIVSVAVQPGDTVAVGQELCVLEAMKMKNAIRATQAGQIAAVRVSPGQHVKHRDVLMEYAE